jgi:predicted membrane protein
MKIEVKLSEVKGRKMKFNESAFHISLNFLFSLLFFFIVSLLILRTLQQILFLRESSLSLVRFFVNKFSCQSNSYFILLSLCCFSSILPSSKKKETQAHVKRGSKESRKISMIVMNKKKHKKGKIQTVGK